MTQLYAKHLLQGQVLQGLLESNKKTKKRKKKKKKKKITAVVVTVVVVTVVSNGGSFTAHFRPQNKALSSKTC
jgi:flagellar basal body-associated protein FliL